MALGIIAFAVVAIFGLLPVGYRTGWEGRQETRSAYLAEQVLSDLRASQATRATIFYGADHAALKSLPVDLTTAGDYFLSADASSRLTDVVASQEEYQRGVKGAGYLSRITVTPDVVLPDLARVEVEVSGPAEAPLASRLRFNTVTLVGVR